MKRVLVGLYFKFASKDHYLTLALKSAQSGSVVCEWASSRLVWISSQTNPWETSLNSGQINSNVTPVTTNMLSGFLLGEIEGGDYNTASLETSKAGLDAKRQTQVTLTPPPPHRTIYRVTFAPHELQCSWSLFLVVIVGFTSGKIWLKLNLRSQSSQIFRRFRLML